MGLNEDGYISTDIIKLKEEIEKENEELLKIFKELNNIAQDTAFKLKIEKSNVQQIILSGLYLRALSSYQGIYILLCRGMTYEVRVLLRTFLELLFQISAICKDREYTKFYIDQSLIMKKKFHKHLSKWSEELKKHYYLDDMPQLLEQLNLQIKETQAKKKDIIDFAIAGGLTDLYYSQYAVLCLTSHANLMDIKKHFKFNNEGVLDSFNWGPHKKLDDLLITAIINMINVIRSIIDFFVLGTNENINKISDRINFLSKEFYEKQNGKRAHN